MHIILHSSLSGGFNDAMVKKVGASIFVAKFSPEDIAKLVNDHVHAKTGIQLVNL
jgi:two-component system chemotaxis response regulator CheV